MTQLWGSNILAAPTEMAGLGIGTGSPELDGLQHSPQSPELDGRAVTPEGGRWGAAPAVSPLIGTPVPNPPAGEGRGGGEAQGYATATTGSSLPEALIAGQTQQREAWVMDHASTAPEVASPGAGGKPLPQTPEVGKAPSMGAGAGGERVSLAGDAEHGTGVGDVDGDGVESFREGEGQLVESGDGDGGGVEE